MKKRSKVTIITPIYNNKEDIFNAIESIEKQSYKNWEYIIVDDCSTDGVYDLLNEYIEKKTNNGKNKIILLRNKKNKGTYISINKALNVMTGDYFTLLGSDDTFHVNKLRKQVNLLDKNKNILVTDAWYKRNDILVKNNCATLMYRKKIINDIGYFDSIRFGADSEYKHRIYKYYGDHVFKKIPEVLYFAKIRIGSLTRSKITGKKNVRVEYKDNFYKWHRSGKKLYIPYPIKIRPFPVNKIMLP